MVAYCYKVHDSKGRIFKSTCQARSEAALRSQLKAMGYAVNSIVKKPASLFSKEHNRVKQRDIVSMCRQFSIMYNSGLDLMDCLQTVAKENESKRLSKILHDIHDQIAKGSNVADAFSRYQDVFSPFFINMLRTGELTGKLDYVLDKLSIYVEKQYDLKRKVQTALTYDPSGLMSEKKHVLLLAMQIMRWLFVVHTGPMNNSISPYKAAHSRRCRWYVRIFVDTGAQGGWFCSWAG